MTVGHETGARYPAVIESPTAATVAGGSAPGVGWDGIAGVMRANVNATMKDARSTFGRLTKVFL
jgi:hypothetical protein